MQLLYISMFADRAFILIILSYDKDITKIWWSTEKSNAIDWIERDVPFQDCVWKFLGMLATQNIDAGNFLGCPATLVPFLLLSFAITWSTAISNSSLNWWVEVVVVPWIISSSGSKLQRWQSSWLHNPSWINLAEVAWLMEQCSLSLACYVEVM